MVDPPSGSNEEFSLSVQGELKTNVQTILWSILRKSLKNLSYNFKSSRIAKMGILRNYQASKFYDISKTSMSKNFHVTECLLFCCFPNKEDFMKAVHNGVSLTKYSAGISGRVFDLHPDIILEETYQYTQTCWMVIFKCCVGDFGHPWNMHSSDIPLFTDNQKQGELPKKIIIKEKFQFSANHLHQCCPVAYIEFWQKDDVAHHDIPIIYHSLVPKVLDQAAIADFGSSIHGHLKNNQRLYFEFVIICNLLKEFLKNLIMYHSQILCKLTIMDLSDFINQTAYGNSLVPDGTGQFKNVNNLQYHNHIQNPETHNCPAFVITDGFSQQNQHELPSGNRRNANEISMANPEYIEEIHGQQDCILVEQNIEKTRSLESIANNINVPECTNEQSNQVDCDQKTCPEEVSFQTNDSIVDNTCLTVSPNIADDLRLLSSAENRISIEDNNDATCQAGEAINNASSVTSFASKAPNASIGLACHEENLDNLMELDMHIINHLDRGQSNPQANANSEVPCISTNATLHHEDLPNEQNIVVQDRPSMDNFDENETNANGDHFDNNLDIQSKVFNDIEVTEGTAINEDDLQNSSHGSSSPGRLVIDLYEDCEPRSIQENSTIFQEDLSQKKGSGECRPASRSIADLIEAIDKVTSSCKVINTPTKSSEILDNSKDFVDQPKICFESTIVENSIMSFNGCLNKLMKIRETVCLESKPDSSVVNVSLQGNKILCRNYDALFVFSNSQQIVDSSLKDVDAKIAFRHKEEKCEKYLIKAKRHSEKTTPCSLFPPDKTVSCIPSDKGDTSMSTGIKRLCSELSAEDGSLSKNISLQLSKLMPKSSKRRASDEILGNVPEKRLKLGLSSPHADLGELDRNIEIDIIGNVNTSKEPMPSIISSNYPLQDSIYQTETDVASACIELHPKSLMKLTKMDCEHEIISGLIGILHKQRDAKKRLPEVGSSNEIKDVLSNVSECRRESEQKKPALSDFRLHECSEEEVINHGILKLLEGRLLDVLYETEFQVIDKDMPRILPRSLRLPEEENEMMSVEGACLIFKSDAVLDTDQITLLKVLKDEINSLNVQSKTKKTKKNLEICLFSKTSIRLDSRSCKGYHARIVIQLLSRKLFQKDYPGIRILQTCCSNLILMKRLISF